MQPDARLKNLPTASSASLFRLLDTQLRADPVVRGAVKVFRSWLGRPEDKVEPSIGQTPWVRLTPRQGPEDWWAASTQKGWLFVDCELWVEGYCFDDVMNLWWAMQRACYPADAPTRNAFQKRLRDAGAHTGLIGFSQAVLVPGGNVDGCIKGLASFAVEYRFDTNPTAPGF